METADWTRASHIAHLIVDNVERVVLGKRIQVELVVMALIAGGHVLIDDVPGTGKTSLVSALARSIDCGFSRIQFTPDVLPSDVVGYSLYNQKEREFEFRAGAVMSNIVLVDEINRASARTQAALLEAMAERQVTVDQTTYRMDEPFMVLATQNPVDQQGTYALPEAQLDRFIIKLSMGYPAIEEEVDVALGQIERSQLHAVASADDVLFLRDVAASTHVSEPVARYAVELVNATRDAHELRVGASPRASIGLVDMARANAVMRGRTYVLPDDIKYLAPYVLGHRIALTHEAISLGRTPEGAIAAIVRGVSSPALSSVKIGGRHGRI